VLRFLQMKVLFVIRLTGLCVIAAALAFPAKASIIAVTFGESLDLPVYDSVSPGANVVADAGVTVPATVAIGDFSTVSNPNGWAGVLDLSFDPTTNVLSVTADDPTLAWDYQIITVTLSGITFSDDSVVSGFSEIGTGINAVVPAVGNAVTPQLSTDFTSDSVTLTYQVPDLTSSKVIYIPASGTDQFQLSTSAAATVPEPASVVLGGLALASLSMVRRRF
jgi:hypothetical protein